MSVILRGMGKDQSLVSRGFISAFFYPPFKEILNAISRVTLLFNKDSVLWRS